MTTSSVVIGSNYGDEGKGHVTDWLAEKFYLVVRFNGGAQAGHTVKTPNGSRHVFHHFGSGTFQEARTYLSRFFVVNPILFVQESEQLRNAPLKNNPVVFVDPDCPVTTPYDMLLNQAAERARGKGRHGSCGVGINETVVRHMHDPFKIHFKDLKDKFLLREKLLAIRKKYIPMRAEQLGVHEPVPYLFDYGLEFAFMHDIDTMLAQVTEVDWKTITSHGNWGVVFEGAQGLRLDECSPDFPHVTRSRTGLTNVLELLGNNDHVLDVYYVTRPYITRHGAGPLKHELEGPPHGDVKDETNVPHPYQGTLRFAEFDVDEWAEFIRADLDQLAQYPRIKASKRIVLTCADQFRFYNVSWWYGGYRKTTSVDVLARYLKEELGADKLYITTSDTREGIEEL